jgi:hypothetical protein
VWPAEAPEMMLHVVGRWEHEGTSADVGTMGDGPTMVTEDDVAILLAECRLGVLR